MVYKVFDIRGNETLSFMEVDNDIPFTVKRVYYVYGEDEGTHRGFHAHKTQWEVVVCVYGAIKFILDDGIERVETVLDDPAKGLLLPPYFWRETVWMQSGSVLCVVSADFYDESDYLRDYDEFLEYFSINKGDKSG